VGFGGKDVYIDLGAERDALDPMLAAERGTMRIAVEIKTFTGPSVIGDLEQAIGQYLLYRSWLRRTEPERLLHLAVDTEAALGVFEQEFGRIVADDLQIRLIVVDTTAERDMDALSRYRQIITGLLSDLAEAGAQAEVDILPVFDSVHDNYLLVDAGWDGVQRIHHIIVHLRLRNGKVWVEADNTDAKIVQQLLDAGLTKDEIVLAFYSPRKRPLTEFAVA